MVSKMRICRIGRPPDGAGKLGIEEAAFAHLELDRAHAALGLRLEGVAERLDREHGIGARVVDVGVDRGRHCIRRAREVELDLAFAVEGDVDGHLDRLGAGPVVVHVVFEAVGAGRHFGQHLAHGRFRAVEDRRVGAARRLQCRSRGTSAQARRRRQVRGVLRQEIAAHLVGHAHVAEHDAHDVVVDAAFAHEAHGQDAQALLERFRDAVHLLRAGRRAAHVDLVRRAANETDQLGSPRKPA